ncbi:DotD/TraH family lipoprotein [Paracoccus litorisediminis]|uniref:DotD/TraH family lipoprotein n=1 Tax=Paracoccus litorisediminis TaxID=2006130 RepID=UPI003732F442
MQSPTVFGRRGFAALVASTLLLSACAATKVEQVDPIPEIDGKIAKAVEESANANKAISEVEVATAAPKRAGPGSTVPAGVVLPPESIQPVTLDWNGPIEPLLEDMAKRAGYSFRKTGNEPANKVMISITAREEPLFGVVRRAGAMAHGYADIGFNPTSRIIEIRYGG